MHASMRTEGQETGTVPSCPQSTLLRLPPVLVLECILPFLPLQDKLLELTHVSHTFPRPTSASFRHDHLHLHLDKARPLLALSASPFSHLSSVSSLWADAGTDVSQSPPSDDVIAADLRCLTPFRAISTLRLLYPRCPPSRQPGFLQQLLTIHPPLDRLTSLSLSLSPPVTDLLPLALLELRVLYQLPSLTALAVESCAFDVTAFRLMLGLPSLRLLDLRRSAWSDLSRSGGPLALVALTTSADPTFQMPPPTPTLRSLLLPERRFRIEHAVDVVGPLLTSLLPQLQQLDTGDFDVSAVLLATPAPSLTALHISQSLHVVDVLLALHSDGLPCLPELRHLTAGRIKQSYNHGEVEQRFLGMLHSHCAQLQSLDLHLGALRGFRIPDLFSALFSCAELRVLKLRAVPRLRLPPQPMDANVAYEQPASPLPVLLHLHTLQLVWEDDHSSTVAAGVSTLLTACPLLRHLHLHRLGVAIELLVRLAGRLCPGLVTLWLTACGDLSGVQSAARQSVEADLSRPLLPALEAACIVHQWHGCSKFAPDFGYRFVAETLRWVTALAGLLATESAPRLQHLQLHPGEGDKHGELLTLDLTVVPQLRRLGRLRSLGGVTKQRPASWRPYERPPSDFIEHDGRQRLQRLFDGVHGGVERTVGEVVRQMRKLNDSPPLYFHSEQDREAFFDREATWSFAQPTVAAGVAFNPSAQFALFSTASSFSFGGTAVAHPATTAPSPAAVTPSLAVAPVPALWDAGGTAFKPKTFAELAAKQKASSRWECPACETPNVAESSRCGACETPKPGSAAPPAELLPTFSFPSTTLFAIQSFSSAAPPPSMGSSLSSGWTWSGSFPTATSSAASDGSSMIGASSLSAFSFPTFSAPTAAAPPSVSSHTMLPMKRPSLFSTGTSASVEATNSSEPLFLVSSFRGRVDQSPPDSLEP